MESDECVARVLCREDLTGKIDDFLKVEYSDRISEKVSDESLAALLPASKMLYLFLSFQSVSECF